MQDCTRTVRIEIVKEIVTTRVSFMEVYKILNKHLDACPNKHIKESFEKLLKSLNEKEEHMSKELKKSLYRIQPRRS